MIGPESRVIHSLCSGMELHHPIMSKLWDLGGRTKRKKKVKNHEGSYDKEAKKSKNSNRNIKNRDAPTLKLATKVLKVFVNAHWASFCAMDVSSNIKLRLLLMLKYCN